MLHLIGLGLNDSSITKEGLESIKRCKKIYLDNYTINLPYNYRELEKTIKKKIIVADRDLFESGELIKEAKKYQIALLVYGSPLFATTHITIIEEAKRLKMRYKIIYNASVFDAVSESGLQLYKFGKITSLPDWEDKGESYSFIEVIKDNLKINAHSLILVDIGLPFHKALEELEISCQKKKLKINKIVVCEKLGTEDSNIIYDTLNKLKKIEINKPFSIIIPGKLHFVEEEFLQKI